MRAKKFGCDLSDDKKLARLIKFGAVTDQVSSTINITFSLIVQSFIINCI